MRIKGKIKNWNNDKGFGFIEPSLGGKDVFVHVSSLINKKREPKLGQVVTFTMATDKQGRTCAGNVALPGDKVSKVNKAGKNVLSFVVATIFLAVIGFLVSSDKLPNLFLLLYILASLFAFIMYALDKSAAKNGRWRTPEANLHLVSLIGGWPGALIAQNVLRHKSKKQSFLFTYWVTVILNCGALLWVMTPEGSKVFNAFISKVI